MVQQAAEAEELLAELEVMETKVDLVAAVLVKLLYHLLHNHLLVVAVADLVIYPQDLEDLEDLAAELVPEIMPQQTLEAAAEPAALQFPDLEETEDLEEYI
jgi:hypothetical protein